MKNISIALILIGSLILVSADSYGAVTSVGEINVVGQKEGIVPASSTVPLLVTLVIDRSLAEPGEEIKTIEITMPRGFLTKSSFFRGISRDGNQNCRRVQPFQQQEVPCYALNSRMLSLIFRTRSMKLPLSVRHRIRLIPEAVFRARLRNLQDGPIGEFIRPGQADGKLNNDDFTLQVIPNVPPDPVIGFTAEADKTGENDVTLRWQKSTDPDVNGYLIYRDKDDSTIEVENRSSTTFRDVNVPPGNHTYQITAYKTLFLQSERSLVQTVNVSPDTAAPKPPINAEHHAFKRWGRNFVEAE